MYSSSISSTNSSSCCTSSSGSSSSSNNDNTNKYYNKNYYYYSSLFSCLPVVLDRCVFGPCSSSPLRESRNLRGIFAGCMLFSEVMLFGVDLSSL